MNLNKPNDLVTVGRVECLNSLGSASMAKGISLVRVRDECQRLVHEKALIDLLECFAGPGGHTNVQAS